MGQPIRILNSGASSERHASLPVMAGLSLSMFLFCGDEATNPPPPTPTVDFTKIVHVRNSNNLSSALDGEFAGLDTGLTLSKLQYDFKGNCLLLRRDSVTLDSTVFSIDSATAIHPPLDSMVTFYPMDLYIIGSVDPQRVRMTIKTIFRINITGSFTMLEIVLNDPGAPRPGAAALETNALVKLRLSAWQ